MTEPTTATRGRAAIYIRLYADCPRDVPRVLLSQCEDVARARGLTPILVLEDRATSGTLDGPGLTRLREAVQYRLVDAVVAVQLSRWLAALADLEVVREEFARAGVDLSILSDAAGLGVGGSGHGA